MSFFLSQIDSYTINQSPYRAKIIKIIESALNAADPSVAVHRVFQCEGDQILLNGKDVFSLNTTRRIFIIGFGKAACPMIYAVRQIIGTHPHTSFAITKDGYLKNKQPDIEYFETGHPIPDHRSMAAAQYIKNLLSNTTNEDLVIFCISGGGSALLSLPVNGIELGDIQILTSELLKCGATIDEINTLRKHLDKIKGGQLVTLTMPASTIALILSDVVGDPLDRIASGPSVADPSTYQDALQILEKYQLTERVPENIFHHLKQGRNGLIPETPKPGNPIFSKVINVLVGGNSISAHAAILSAEEQGFNTFYLGSSIQGEAKEVGKYLSSMARKAVEYNQPVECPGCIIAGGETTVTLKGNGLGGRNQELALAAVKELAGLPATCLISFSTDGTDGPTDAAGAVVSGETYARANRLHLDPESFLNNNDSYHFFDRLGDLLRLGPTQTNVNDIMLIFTT
jgi:glycerate 2-kinase